jgi:hypothetical protein
VITLPFSYAAKIATLVTTLVALLILVEVAGLGISYLMTQHEIRKSDQQWCQTLTVFEKHSVYQDTKANLVALQKEFKCADK